DRNVTGVQTCALPIYIAVTLEYLVRLHTGEREMKAPNGEMIPVNTDDIDHFGNRRLRTVGELIQNQVRVGLSRMERVVRERMTTQDAESITRSEEHTSELQSRFDLVCRLLLEKK